MTTIEASADTLEMLAPERSAVTDFKALLEAMGDAVMVLEADGVISYLTPACRTLLFSISADLTLALGNRLIDLIDSPVLRQWLQDDQRLNPLYLALYDSVYELTLARLNHKTVLKWRSIPQADAADNQLALLLADLEQRWQGGDMSARLDHQRLPQQQDLVEAFNEALDQIALPLTQLQLLLQRLLGRVPKEAGLSVAEMEVAVETLEARSEQNHQQLLELLGALDRAAEYLSQRKLHLKFNDQQQKVTAALAGEHLARLAKQAASHGVTLRQMQRKLKLAIDQLPHSLQLAQPQAEPAAVAEAVPQQTTQAGPDVDLARLKVVAAMLQRAAGSIREHAADIAIEAANIGPSADGVSEVSRKLHTVAKRCVYAVEMMSDAVKPAERVPDEPGLPAGPVVEPEPETAEVALVETELPQLDEVRVSLQVFNEQLQSLIDEMTAQRGGMELAASAASTLCQPGGADEQSAAMLRQLSTQLEQARSALNPPG
ncbi:hypothetical protein [Marinobacterium jannaschii]|uniref:hypothetical protein n=1 Tax=Marinobacterium jannaschii TaxID=64970 RepID=UPI000482984F|nr:hypothetical protein [Marinobacterium jannaschii]